MSYASAHREERARNWRQLNRRQDSLDLFLERTAKVVGAAFIFLFVTLFVVNLRRENKDKNQKELTHARIR